MTHRVAALGLAGILGLVAMPAFGEAASGLSRGLTDVDRLQMALAQEQKAEFLYLLAVGSGRLRSSYPTLVAIHDRHLQAATALTETITQLGATPVRPRSFNDYVDEAHAMSATSENDVVDLARSLERDGAAVYARLGPHLQDTALAQRLARLRKDDEASEQALRHAVGG